VKLQIGYDAAVKFQALFAPRSAISAKEVSAVVKLGLADLAVL
jgi:hypothetical protein